MFEGVKKGLRSSLPFRKLLRAVTQKDKGNSCTRRKTSNAPCTKSEKQKKTGDKVEIKGGKFETDKQY